MARRGVSRPAQRTPAAVPSGPSLSRHRLVQRLLQLPPGGVALIVAPDGYGGTVLLHEAAARSAARSVWLGGPSRAGGSQTFWAAAHSALSEGVGAPPLLPSQRDPRVREPLVGELGSSLAAGAGDLLLVIGDVGTDPAFDEQLQVLVDELPETARLMIRARRMPHLDLSRHLARGRLVLLDRWDLSLDQQEAEEYVSSLAPHLPPERRDALIEVSEGWIGALHAALGAGQHAGRADDPVAWLQGPGLDLMFGRWISTLDPDDADLLVDSSVLEVLTPESCDRITGRSDSASRLATLAQAQVVAPPAGAAGVQYRCHGLLRTYLLGQLAARGRPAVARAHTELGRWLAEQGDVEAGITHLLDSGHVDEAGAVLAAHAGTLIDSGRRDQVRAWYRREPLLARGEHRGVLAAAWSELLSGDPSGAESHLVELDAVIADTSFRPADDGSSQQAVEWLRTEADYLRAHILVWGGRTDRAQELVHQVRSRYADEWDRTAPQSAAIMEVRLDLWNGQDESARAELRALNNRPGTQAHFRRLALPSLSAYLAARDGQAHRARFLAEQALATLAETGMIGVLDAGDALLARATANIDLGEDQLALADAVELTSRASGAGHASYEIMAGALQAVVWAGVGDGDGALAALDEARQVLRERGAGNSLRALLDATEVEVAVRAGDRSRAKHLLRQLPEGPVRDRLAVRVAAMGAGVWHADAVKLVRSVRTSAPRDVVEARMLMASVATGSRGPEAESHLLAAVTMAYEFGMHRALVGRAEALQVLAARMAEREPSPAIVALVAGATREEAAEPSVVPAYPELSPGERELLDALVEESAYRHLAESLGVSINTVKTRLRRLYAKLGAHDRETALRRVGKVS